MPRCPSCDEKVSAKDAECPYCGEVLKAGSGRSKSRKRPVSKSRGSGSSIMLVLGIVGVGFLMCSGVMAALLLPAVQQAREAARRTQCKNNMKMMGLAMHNYHDTYRLFPAAHLNDDDGTPRVSWRVSILPYMDQAPLYNLYRFNESWDGPTNSTLLRTMPMAYTCPSNPPGKSTNTSYVTISGSNTLLGAGTCTSMNDVTDGLSNTLMVVEGCQMNIPWMMPRDIDQSSFTKMNDPNGASSKHIGVVHVLMGDGSVRAVSNNISTNVVKALITRDGNEPVGEF